MKLSSGSERIKDFRQVRERDRHKTLSQVPTEFIEGAKAGKRMKES